MNNEEMITIESNICFECGSDMNIHNHHVVPKVLGGTKTIPLCTSCHSKVHSKNLTKFSKLARIGRMKYVANGGKLGRPEGAKESNDKFLSKPKNQEIFKLLQRGLKYSEIQKVVGCSPKTIKKVKEFQPLLAEDNMRKGDRIL